MKKLPSIFRKKYTAKKLQKKIYRKIFIPADTKYIQSLFKEAGTTGKKKIPVYAVPSDRKFDKKELKRLKLLAKQIKKQGGRIKVVPLAACVVFAVLVCGAVAFGKNIFVKKGIQTVCENMFGAKCDIAAVDMDIFGSSLTVTGFAVADKSQPMKNLFAADSIIVDFDLVQLLKAKFAADNLSVTGMATGSDRTVSGELPPKKAKKIAEKKAKKETAEESAFSADIKKKALLAADSLKNSLSGMFDQYNPQSILTSCYAQLQSPAAAENAEKELQRIIPAWKETPAALEKSARAVKDSAEKAIAIDLNKIKSDPVQIKNALETLNSAVSDIKKFKTDVENTATAIKDDAATVQRLSADIQAAVSHDMKIANTEIAKITSFSLSDGKRFISGTLDTAAYQLLGKYYPYMQKAVGYLSDMKAAQKNREAPAVKIKKTPVSRAAGRTVVYRKDTVPTLLIKKTEVSGSDFSATVTDISNDMDLWGKPAVAQVACRISGCAHHVQATVDARENSEAPLVAVTYKGSRFPLRFSAADYIDAPGMPDFTGTCAVEMSGTADEDNSFSISGTGSFSGMSITAAPFEPEFASSLYAKTLAGITAMQLNVQAAYTAANGMALSLSSDADKKFANSLTAQMNAEIAAVKKSAQQELTAKLSEITGGVLSDITSFDDIKTKIAGQTKTLDSLNAQVEAKKKEAESYLKQQAESAAKDAAGTLLKKLF